MTVVDGGSMRCRDVMSLRVCTDGHVSEQKTCAIWGGTAYVLIVVVVVVYCYGDGWRCGKPG